MTKPERGVHDGEGVCLNEASERRIPRARPCTRYPGDDFFDNPYGLTRTS